jgi:AAT family amino acid transporter
MAIDSLAWRILIFYMGAILVILAIFPWNQIGQEGSPFVVMFERIGLREAAGLINFVVITAALSSCNAGIFSGGRLLYALSVNGYAPAPFAKLSKYGVPHRAVMTTVAVCMTGVVLNYFVPEKAFQYIMAAVTFVGLMVWIAILLTQMKFRRSLSAAQVAELNYKAPFTPYTSWFALAFICLVIVLMGFHEDARIALVLGPCLLAVYLMMFYVVGLHRTTKLNRKFK